MKIESGNTQTETRSSNRKRAFKGSGLVFQHFMESPQSKEEPVSAMSETASNLEADLAELDELGKELLLRRSLGALDKYKKKLKSLLKNLDAGAETHVVLSETHTNHRRLHITREIDASLSDLARQVMETERGNLELAQSIDNIKGLLLDYTR